MSEASPAPASFTDSLYQEIHGLARARLRGRAAASLSATALVSEAWIKMAGYMTSGSVISSRGKFLALASSVVRSIAVDHARRRAAQKRNAGPVAAIAVEEIAQFGHQVEILSFDHILHELRELSPRMHTVVEMKVFGGCAVADIAMHLDVSERTVKGDWKTARAWLASRLPPPA